MSVPVRAEGRPEGADLSGICKEAAHRIVSHAVDTQEGHAGHGNGMDPRVAAKGEALSEARGAPGDQSARVAAKGVEEVAPAGPADVGRPPEQQQPSLQHERQARPQRERPQGPPSGQPTTAPGKAAEHGVEQGPPAARQGRGAAEGTGKAAGEAAEGGMRSTAGAAQEAAGAGAEAAKAAGRGAADTAREGAATVAKGGGAAAAGGAELAEQAGRGAAGAASATAKGAEAAAKPAASAAEMTAKGAAGAGRAAKDAAGATAEAAGGAAKGATGAARGASEAAGGVAKGAAEMTGGAAKDAAGVAGGAAKGAAGAAGGAAKGAAGAARGAAEAAGGVAKGAAEMTGGAAKDAAGVAGGAAKGAAGIAGGAAKGAAGAARGAAEAAGGVAKGAVKGATEVAGGAAKGVGDAAKLAARGAGKAADAAMAAPGAVVSGAKGAADATRSAAGTAASGARSAVQTGRGAARTGAWAVGASADAVQRGAVRVAQVVQTLLHWWYLLVVQLPYRLAAGAMHMSWVVGHMAVSVAGRSAVWFMERATWAGELTYKWLLDGIVRVNRGMDAAISATPPLVKGQLARAAVVTAPEGPNLVDSLTNKSPAQVGGIFRGLTAAAAAAKNEPLVVGGNDKGPGGGGGQERGQDLVEQVNAALHAAFDRPDVPLGPEQAEAGQQQQQQRGAGGTTEGLRSVDVLHDKLLDQARLLVWHFWMVGRLQLTAAAEVAAVTRGMWSWLLRCLAHLSAAVALLAAMAVAAAGGAVVAAAAGALASVVRQLQTAAAMEVRARRIWAPLALRLVDTASALASPLLRAPPLSSPRGALAGKEPAPAAAKEGAPKAEGEEGAAGAKERVPGQEAMKVEGGVEGAEKEVAEGKPTPAGETGKPKGVMAAAATALSPLWEAIRGGQAYARDSLVAVRQFVQGMVPKDPEREEAEAARAVESFAGLSAVLRSSDVAFSTTWRLAQASMAALTDLTGNLITDVARRYHIPIPKFAWFKGKAAQLAQDTAIASFAKVAGTGPASMVAGMVGANAPPAAGGKAADAKNGGGAAAEAAPAQEGRPTEGQAAGGEGKQVAEGERQAPEGRQAAAEVSARAASQEQQQKQRD
ncbi:hypothetical protein PLESTB_000477800 [Pleodorina starrii]|uniref:Uncharacterized protein n=1 Tax=Pleodorina starrii TaxID=330485 RepID=A0A9W6BFH4_9CHLO|nr:hypothetical protein PLESTM_001588700 [Pleodorina starrii]GLC51212.1 hypothetical protein PLESTB_000477800 [Pleodorina starrii]GLC63571.1 hypothetical protein PLESTF_000050400 [Pleodorina starrii]